MATPVPFWHNGATVKDVVLEPEVVNDCHVEPRCAERGFNPIVLFRAKTDTVFVSITLFVSGMCRYGRNSYHRVQRRRRTSTDHMSSLVMLSAIIVKTARDEEVQEKAI